MTKYVTLHVLGEGGMGVVYMARQEPLGREVAIKYLTGASAANAEFRKRFEREVAVSLRLEHPNIIKLLDAGVEDGRCFYVMEYLAGARPLDDLVAAEGALPVERALDIALQLADALAHCHAAGVVHRDVKPANAMLTASGRAILMDFGLVTDPGATLLTQPGHVVGTPRYLAPELLRGQTATPATDLWALGATIYELLTGRQAFGGPSMMEITRGILREEPPAPSTVRAGLPPQLDQLIADLLAKEPAQRVPDAATARARIEEVLAATGKAVPLRPRRRTQPAVRLSRSTAAVSEPPRGRIALAAGAALVVALLVALTVGLRARPAAAPVVAVASSAAAPAAPEVDAADAAARLEHAIDTLAPLALQRPMVGEFVKAHRRKPSPAEQQAYQAVVNRWRNRIAVALVQSRVLEAARAFSPVRDRAFGAGGLPAESQRRLAERIQDVLELATSAQALGAGEVLLPPLTSPRYGQVAQSTVASPAGGGALILERDRAPFAREAGAAPDVVPLTLEESDVRRMRAVTDPRLPDLEAEMGTAYRLCGKPILARGAETMEVRAAMSDTRPELGMRVLIARTEPATDTRWLPIAWMRPAKSHEREFLYHTLPPGLLAGGPLWVRVEVMYSWPLAILERLGAQDVQLPWLFLAAPR